MDKLLQKENEIIDKLCDMEGDIDKAYLVIADLEEGYTDNSQYKDRIIGYIRIAKDYSFSVADQIKRLRNELLEESEALHKQLYN